MKLYLKVIGSVHVILAFLQVLLLLKLTRRRWLLRVLVLLRRINVYSRSQHQNKVQHIHIHANKVKTKKQYNNT